MTDVAAGESLGVHVEAIFLPFDRDSTPELEWRCSGTDLRREMYRASAGRRIGPQ